MKALPLKIFIFVFCVFLFSFGIQNLSLEFKGDENFYFASAKEMLETKDIVTPRYMGEERFQKPPLFYWFILPAFKIFGINWFAARLPSALFGALLALLVFRIANLLFEDRKISLFAALFLATTPLCYRYARLAVPEMALTFFITLALYYFARYYKDRKDTKSPKLFFLAVAFAFLIKGPVGVIVPLLVSGVFCLIKREKRLFSLRDVLTGIAIFALITGPWFYLMYKAHGEAYTSHIWVREILQRLGFGYEDAFVTRYFKGFLFYIGALISRFIPYSLFMPIALINSFSLRSIDSSKQGEKDGHLFLIVWAVTVFLFFTFVAEKRAHYLLALSPALAIMIGAIFRKAVLSKNYFLKIGFRIPYFAAIIAIIFFAIAFIFSDYVSGSDKIPIWKFGLIIVPVILIAGLRRKNSFFMPLSLILALSLLYIGMSISTPFGLFKNKMERAAAAIKSELKEGDGVAIGSHGIIPEELQVFFEFPVANLKVMYNRDGTPNFNSASGLKSFLSSKERIFCVIKRRDYDNFISEEVKANLCILDNYYVWKRRIKFDKELKDSLGSVGIRSFREIFQNEIYVITNVKSLL